MELLTISGSLRAQSSNTRLLHAAALLAPEGVSVTFYDRMNDLPHFNPDLDTEPAPQPVTGLRAALRRADALMISSPEYAHGVPGVLKNALDWVVGSGELVNKPVALINASPRAVHAYASLAETLRTMSAMIVPEASITLSMLGSKAGAAEIAADPTMSPALCSAMDALLQAAGVRAVATSSEG